MPNRWTTLRLAGACAFLMTASVHRVEADEVSPRVRPVDARIASLLARGSLTSPTLARLVGALEHSDIIVHVEQHRVPQRRAIGGTRFVTRAGGQRYLRIFVDNRLPDDAAIALLGHELHHAWEIAQTPWVVDDETLRRLYRQIGHETAAGPRSIGVDTRAARNAAQLVHAELRASDRGKPQPAAAVSGDSMKR